MKLHEEGVGSEHDGSIGGYAHVGATLDITSTCSSVSMLAVCALAKWKFSGASATSTTRSLRSSSAFRSSADLSPLS
ncbi:MAG: hypothetical protein SGI72_17285 [Planctomycetota bacterium]|nr:hypothetical protein [Planctomycetota bacterium]